jgi:hypothetical protein
MATVHPQQSPQQQNNSMDRRASLASSNSSNNGSPFNDSSQGLVITAATKKGGHQPVQKLYLPDLTLALPGNKNMGQTPNFLAEKKLADDLEGGNEPKKVVR